MPLSYILVSYGAALASGLVRLDGAAMSKLGLLDAFQIFVANPVLLCIIVLGEEIGWRGFLLPRLCRIMGYPKASALVGTAWILFHLPVLLFSDYNGADTPAAFRVACFVVLAFGANAAINWIRMKSGSLWPAVLFHATHNSLLQDINPLFAKTELSGWILQETGLALAAAGAIVGIVFLLKRKDVVLREPAPPGR